MALPVIHADCLVNGVSICTTKAICVAADTPVAAVFATGADIPKDSFVTIVTTAGDLFCATGVLVLRPYLGPNERSASTTNQKTIDQGIDASRNDPPEFAEQTFSFGMGPGTSTSDSVRLYAFKALHGYKPVSMTVSSPAL